MHRACGAPPLCFLFVPDMEAVRRAATGAVDTIRNSPLFRRKFGTYQRSENDSEEEEERPAGRAATRGQTR